MTKQAQASETDLIKLIHHGPLETRPMANAIKALRQALKASFIGLTLQQPALVRPLLLHIQDSEFDDDAFMERYLNRYAEDDPFPYHQLEPYRIYNATELLGRDWREGAYYRQFLQPHGLHEVLLVRLEVVGSLNAYLFAIRSKGQPRFSAREMALLERLLPHLSQALDVSARIRRLDAERQIYEQAVEAMGIGTILLNGLGDVIYTDLLAIMLMANQSILVLRDVRLTCELPQQREQLRELINRALADPTGSLSHALTLVSGGDELMLLVRAVACPLSVSNEPAPRVAIFLSNRAKRPTVPREAIRELFGLSRVEAELAMALAEGSSLTEAAHLLNISQHTARSYSKRIYSKTGARGQSELVQRILVSVARVGGQFS